MAPFDGDPRTYTDPQVKEAGELDEVGKVLMRAAERCRMYGLYKGNFGPANRHLCDTVPRCTVGHIIRAAQDCGLPTTDYRPYKAVEAQIGMSGVITWSDAPERTAEEVIDALESAARAR